MLLLSNYNYTYFYLFYFLNWMRDIPINNLNYKHFFSTFVLLLAHSSHIYTAYKTRIPEKYMAIFHAFSGKRN